MEEERVDKVTTLHYRAPELVDLHMLPRRPVGDRVDVWALGCALYRMAFSVTPFEDAAGSPLRMGILSGR